MDWQPIETAPKDGTEILIYQQGHPFKYDFAIGRWLDGGWSNRNSSAFYQSPTHWMPLTPPTDPERE